LSDLVTAIFSSNLLEQAENFYTQFLNVDTIIIKLQNELILLDEFLYVAKSLYAKFYQELLSKIKIAEENFNELKGQFFDYLLGIA